MQINKNVLENPYFHVFNKKVLRCKPALRELQFHIKLIALAQKLTELAIIFNLSIFKLFLTAELVTYLKIIIAENKINRQRSFIIVRGNVVYVVLQRKKVLTS